MLRTTITPVTTQVQISIPKKYVGKKVEILLFAVDEPAEEEPVKKMQWKKYKGILSAKRAKEMQQYVQQSRNEW
jgi:hypothetical protein